MKGPTCKAYADDGQLCGLPATHVDPVAGMMVCYHHAPAGQTPERAELRAVALGLMDASNCLLDYSPYHDNAKLDALYHTAYFYGRENPEAAKCLAECIAQGPSRPIPQNGSPSKTLSFSGKPRTLTEQERSNIVPITRPFKKPFAN